MEQEPLDIAIKRMKDIGEILTPYTFPVADMDTEDEISELKYLNRMIDGYYIRLNFSIADYSDHYLYTLQVTSESFPFLPFTVVLKLARKFLGDEHLSLVEILKSNRKIYCWTLFLDREKKPLHPKYKDQIEHCMFEGFDYTYVHPGQLKFY